MALLEKIRQRKKILAIVIGGALLAFIVEVGVEALGRGANGSTIAKVGGEEIDVQTFQNRVQEVSSKEQEQNQGRQADVDQAVRQSQVLEEMIGEKLLEQEYNEVGIECTDAEVTELMIGNNPHPMAMQFAQSVGAGSPAELNDFLNNPSKYGAKDEQVAQMRVMWNDCQKQVVENYLMAKLSMLVNSGLQANDLDLKQMEEDQATMANITYVKKGFETLADDKYSVSDEEIKAEWEKRKKMFALDEETRAIHFIAVPVVPSPADIKAADAIADKAYAALQKGTGIDSVRVLGSVKVVESQFMPLSQFPANLISFASSSEIGSVKRDSLASGQYAMYKITDRTTSLDSVLVDQFVVEGAKSTQDSVLNMLNAGTPVADITKKFKKSNSQADTWIQIANAEDSVKSKVANAGEGYFVLFSSDKGAQFMKVREKKAPKAFFKLATVTYEAFASAKTGDDLTKKLQGFLNKNKTTEALYKNAPAAGYQAIPMDINGSTPQIGMSQYGQGMKDSRKAIKWAMENDKGAISPIFTENHDYLLVVAVDEVYDGEYVPCTDEGVKEYLTTVVRNNKKGEDLMKKYNGKAKDLNGYAQQMQCKVDTAQVSFGNDMMMPVFGNEPGFVGRVAAAKKGQMVGLWKGQNGVYAFQVNSVEKSARKMEKKELNEYYSRSHQLSPNALVAILSKATKVERHMQDFF